MTMLSTESVDCGNFTGMSYGKRKRRSPHELPTGSGKVYSVRNEVTVVDDTTTHMKIPQSKKVAVRSDDVPTTGNVISGNNNNSEEIPFSRWWIAGSMATVTMLIMSLIVNAILLNKVNNTNKRFTRKTIVPIKVVEDVPEDKEIEVIYDNMSGLYLGR